MNPEERAARARRELADQERALAAARAGALDKTLLAAREAERARIDSTITNEARHRYLLESRERSIASVASETLHEHLGATVSDAGYSHIADMQRSIQQNIEARAEEAESQTARRAVYRLVDEIRQFGAELPDGKGLVLRFSGFSADVQISPTHMHYHQPNLIVFTGQSLDGGRARVVVHLSALNVALTESSSPERWVKIGFTED